MGIRMNIAVGWGLDLHDRNRAMLSFEHLEDETLFEAFKADVLAYAEEHNDLREKSYFDEHMNPATELFQMVIYQEEFGNPDKLLLIPSGYQEFWHRYGNLLDIFEYEATHDYDGPGWMDIEWIEKKGTLYPFIGLMRANPEKPLGFETYWEPFFLDKEEHKNAIPVAPTHLWFLIKHLNLVKAGESVTDAFLSLRPTFYRWWS